MSGEGSGHEMSDERIVEVLAQGVYDPDRSLGYGWKVSNARRQLAALRAEGYEIYHRDSVVEFGAPAYWCDDFDNVTFNVEGVASRWPNGKLGNAVAAIAGDVVPVRVVVIPDEPCRCDFHAVPVGGEG